MIIKVCGMKDPRNMGQVASLPIDLMGMIFYPKSPRYIGSELSLGDLPARARVPGRVGVFVNASLFEIRAAVSYFQLEYVQLHGDESPETCQQIATISKVIKAFRVDESFDFATTEAYTGCSYFLFDARGKQYGGNGHKFNWAKLTEYTGSTPFLLSGGIGPEDAEALRSLTHPQFMGIDLNSGFEQAPGLKEPAIIQKFLAELQ